MLIFDTSSADTNAASNLSWSALFSTKTLLDAVPKSLVASMAAKSSIQALPADRFRSLNLAALNLHLMQLRKRPTNARMIIEEE